MIGRSVPVSKPINLEQLEGEINAAGVATNGISMLSGPEGQAVFQHNPDGTPKDFAEAEQPIVDQALVDHVALRNKTDQEYAAEFQNPETDAARKQEIRDITAGLLPREQVPMTQEEWDSTRGMPV